MFCHRCRGLLVYERLNDLTEQAGAICPATRCLNCGCIEDSVIRFNRLHPAATRRALPHRAPRTSIWARPPTPPGGQLLRPTPVAQAKA